MNFERRFGGIARLYGESALQRFCAAHVVVAGIGGVGSWAAEALARSAIGHFTLIDLDHIAESNTNRQIHALEGEYGKAKVTAMAQRIRAINPACQVTEIDDFVTPENLEALLPPTGKFDYVVDAIDNVRAKAALIAYCRNKRIPIITAGGAGGRRDPTCIRVDDLSRTQQDALASKVRALLRKEHGFPRDLKQKFDVECVFSVELAARPEGAGQACDPEQVTALAGLSCAGYGSSVAVTASFGLAAAARVLAGILRACSQLGDECER